MLLNKTLKYPTMLNPNSILFLLLLCLVASFIYLFIQKRNKFKTACYSISLSPKEALTEYYLVIEMKHGQFQDTRKLSKLSQLFFPKRIIPLLKDTYNDYESAQKSLQELKEKN